MQNRQSYSEHVQELLHPEAVSPYLSSVPPRRKFPLRPVLLVILGAIAVAALVVLLVLIIKAIVYILAGIIAFGVLIGGFFSAISSDK